MGDAATPCWAPSPPNLCNPSGTNAPSFALDVAGLPRVGLCNRFKRTGPVMRPALADSSLVPLLLANRPAQEDAFHCATQSGWRTIWRKARRIGSPAIREGGGGASSRSRALHRVLCEAGRAA